MKYLLLSFGITWLMSSGNLCAQNQTGLPCGTDEMHQTLFNDFPEYNRGIIAVHSELEQFTAEYVQNHSYSRNGNPYIIPVVFHIIHNNGIENINDDQIYDAVKQVNLQMRKLNADTTDIVQDFKSIAADAEIELRLAQLDPNGNCTNGITRTVSNLTNIGDHQVKSLIQWPPDKYLNVYVCNQAAGLAGHALLPAAADTIPQWDGIVMMHSYVGTIGTSVYFNRTVLTHEIGHYLNLQHIWGGNNVPGYYYLPVADPNNCTEDDGVADTPETIGWQSCNLSGNSCGSLDNVQNYMDYAYCARMFTEGQKLRMHAALNSSVANRNNLWSNTNLVATGTLGDTSYLCKAKFTSNHKVICAGETVTFKDISYHGITQRSWNFTGGDVTSSSDSIVQVTYNTPGFYDVSLSVGNNFSSVDTTAVKYITVMQSPGVVSGLIESFEWAQGIENSWVVENEEIPTTWSRIGYGFSSNNSFYVDNFNGGENLKYAFHSFPFDASGMTELAIFFNYAYTKRTSDNNGILKILISKDCGQTWVPRKTLFSTVLQTIEDTLNTVFFPTSDQEWAEEAVYISTASYTVDNLMVKFLFESDQGNNLFIDNIRISSTENIGVKEYEVEESVRLFPNPSQNEFHLYFENEFNDGTFNIYDTYGRKVMSGNLNEQSGEHTFRTDHLNNGTYYLHIFSQDKNHKVTEKMLIIK